MKKAIFAGTFNPFHKGHLSIIEKASKLFDYLYVVVANNQEKEYVDLEKRFIQVQKDVLFENVEVLKMESGLLANFAKTKNVKYLVRSARNGSDFEYELDMAIKNKEINIEIETIIIIPEKDNLAIRSSLIKKQ